MEFPVVPSEPGETNFVIRKSRFIGSSIMVRSAEEARSRVREVRRAHPKANHVVWAFIIGDDRALRGLSDDGEPHGTAGRPILSVLDGSGITDILLMVVRYFGGIKLGTGGLVSAYGRAARETVAAMKTRENVPLIYGTVRLPYSVVDAFKRWIGTGEVRIDAEDFGENVLFRVEVPRHRKDAFENGLRDLTSGTCHFQPDSGDDPALIG